MKRSVLWRPSVLIPAALLALFFICLVLYLYFIAGEAFQSRPVLQITDTYPEEETVAAGQSVVIFGRAEDPEGVKRVELWVNGEKVGEQINPEQGYTGAWNTSSAFIPDDPGDYLVFLRGADREGMIGQSEPLLVTVRDRSTEIDPDATSQYILQDGETIEDVASQFGLDPAEIRDRNPGSDGGGGTSLILPGTSGTADGPSPQDDSISHVIGPPPPPPPGGETPAEPSDPPLASEELLWVRIFCLTRPDFCRSVEGRIEPPAAPDQVSAVSGDLCDAVVSWRDNSEDEVGFLVYRITVRPRLRMELIETVSAAPGAGTRLQVTDPRVPLGEHLYTVRAFNAAGETWGTPSERINSECPAIEPVDPELATIGIEALSFTTAESYDRLYCYFSLAGSSFERIPASASDFIEFERGEWNIAAHLAGRNTRILQVNRAVPLRLDVSCLGWQGDTLMELGRFQREHPSIEWDGHRITTGPDGGGFSVTYRIFLTIDADDEEHSIWMPIIDPNLPAPYNLRDQDYPVDIGGSIPGTDLGWVASGARSFPGLFWQHSTDPVDPQIPRGFRPRGFLIYRMVEGEDADWVLDHEVNAYPYVNGGGFTATRFDDCSKAVTFGVMAVYSEDPLTGDPITSPMSEPITVTPDCLSFQVTIESITSFRSARAYGWFEINGQRLYWNDRHYCVIGVCAAETAPASTLALSGIRLNGMDLFMSNNGRSFARGNNSVRVPIHDGESLYWTFALYNDQDILDDDLFCQTPAGRGQGLLAARSMEDWTAFHQTILTQRYPGNCEIGVFVQPVE
jgi:hypothetical protein